MSVSEPVMGVTLALTVDNLKHKLVLVIKIDPNTYSLITYKYTNYFFKYKFYFKVGTYTMIMLI